MLTQTKYFLVLCALLLTQIVYAQVATVQGTLEDGNTAEPLVGITINVDGTLFTATTNAEGKFIIKEVPQGNYVFEFSGDGYLAERRSIEVNAETINLGTIMLTPGDGNDNALNSEDVIPTILLSDGDLDNGKGGGSENTAGLLNASRDVFASKAAFAFSAARFRIRGYNSENTELLMNGVPVNDVENGRPYWAFWGGLNDVTRNRNSIIGLGSTEYTFGGIGGSSMLDVRASKQWKQLRISYAHANRSYQHRVMATYSTGLLAGGWAFSGSASWRFAPEGMYVKGGYYNALSYFFSVEKITGKHSISLTAFGAPRVRGKSGPATEELFRLANDRYYNPYWGYQTSGKTGKQQVRNSRVANTHMPMAILTHEVEIGTKSSLITSASFQMGRNGSTALDWFNASDPRPDYYRKLPSYIQDYDAATRLEKAYIQDPGRLQVNWDNMYEINRNSFEAVANANGSGDTTWGNRAHYILAERRYDAKKANFATTFKTNLANIVNINAGLTYQWFNGHNFQVIDDLLGADFYVNVDQFAIRDTEQDPTLGEDYYQSDLDCPNCILEKGDKYGYDYETQIHKGGAWVQAALNLKKLDFFVAGRASYTAFWRKNNMRNGRFPDLIGKGETNSYFNYAAKGGLTYKINGRNYLFANGMYMTRAPYMRNAYVSARTRDAIVPGLKSETIYGGEGGYMLRAPKLKAKIVGFYTKFTDQTFYRSFYLDNAIKDPEGGSRGAFVNYIMTGVEKQHAGVEAAAEYSLKNGITFSGAVAWGEYIYTSRPTISAYLDYNQEKIGEDRTAYLKNFFVSGTPQLAANIGFWYRAPKFWSLSVNFNYFANGWTDFNPDRRTTDAVFNVSDPQYQQQAIDPNSQLFRDIIHQEQLPGNFTADIFFTKSWKIKDFFINLNIGVNNVLHNTGIKTSGFEQFRFDYEEKNVEKFPNRYYNAYGVNYFMSLTFRM
ncbi:MAG: TonB-dependent receptor [Aureispira sp.]|nr:TonB-dependent receptor [Aureispira sp.]